jgi:hypothetical protein
MHQGDGETPLSDLIGQHAERPTDRIHAQFLDLFCSSRLGVIGVGAPQGVAGHVESTSERPLHLGMTQHAAGQAMVLAFADPPAFVRTFGQQFNAEMKGDDILKTALHNPECQGVLVNSALSEVSIVIDRATAESRLANQSDPIRGLTKPWWKFW